MDIVDLVNGIADLKARASQGTLVEIDDVPLSDEEWSAIEELADQLQAETGIETTPGEVAGAIMTIGAAQFQRELEQDPRALDRLADQLLRDFPELDQRNAKTG